MTCPNCGGPTRVTDKRNRSQGLYVYRRRQCETCHRRFTTREVTKTEFEAMQRDRTRLLNWKHLIRRLTDPEAI